MRMTQSDKKLFLTIIIPEKFSSWTFSPLLQFILHQFYKIQHIKVWIQDICHSHTNKNDSIWQKNSSWQLIIPKKFSSGTFSPLLRIILHQFKNNYNSIESNISYLRIHLYWVHPLSPFPLPPVVLLLLWFGAGPLGGVCGLGLTGSLNPWCLWCVVC